MLISAGRARAAAYSSAGFDTNGQRVSVPPMEPGTFVKLPSGELYAVDSNGSGIPFVLLHGLGASHASWTELVDPLAERARTIAIDLPGFGFSPPIRRHDLASMSGVVVEFLESLGTASVLIGNSMGGLVAEIVAGTRPDLVQDLILISPASPPPLLSRPTNPRVAARMVAQSFPGVGHTVTDLIRRTVPPEKRTRALLDVVSADSDSLPDRAVEASIDMAIRRSQFPWATRALVEATASIRSLFVPKYRFTTMIRRIETVALVMSGEEDDVVPPPAIDALQRSRPDWTFKRHPGVGHIAQIEDPGWVIHEVDSWLARSRDQPRSAVG